MKVIFLIGALAAGLLAQAPPKLNPDEVVLTVGDRTFTAAQYDELVRAVLPPATQPYALGPGRREFAKKLVELVALGAEAERLHLDKQPSMMLQLDLQRTVRLSTEEFQRLLKELPITDEQIQAYYDSNKQAYEVLNARQILVRVKGSPAPAKTGQPELSDIEAKARAVAIRKRIQDGEDFAKVAREESDDASAAKGGDMGEVRHGATPPPFEQAAFGLKVGDLSDPVRTQFGYHIVQVQSRSVKPLADVREDVTMKVRKSLAPAAAEFMIKRAEVHLDDAFFGPDPAAKPAGAPPVAAPPAPR